MNRIVSFLCLAACLCVTPAQARNTFENDQVRLRIAARTPQQMAAFYEARGFPAEMIKTIGQACFFTVGIKNKTSDILWHDLAGWKFTAAGKPIERFDRAYWQKQWQQLKIPLASQSTFRWTLMPERLDFRPQEHEGGNITLPRGPFIYSIEANFQTGANKSGPEIRVRLEDIRCAEDKAGVNE